MAITTSSSTRVKPLALDDLSRRIALLLPVKVTYILQEPNNLKNCKIRSPNDISNDFDGETTSPQPLITV
jgi:hypothetical protein